LGKWNISCHSSHHRQITNWIDKHLVDIWSKIPLDLPPFDAFSTPERLSRNRIAHSVASGLTDASPVSHYLQSLATRNPATKIATVVRNPWRQTPPVQSVQYSFDKTEYPLPNGKANATATARTKDSTLMDASAGSISQLDGHAASVQQIVDKKLAAIKAARKLTDAEFIARMNTIDDSIQKIKDDLDAIAECVTTRVLTGLQQPEGLLFKQDAKIDLIQAQLMRLLPLVEQSLGLPRMGIAHSPMTNRIPPAKNRNWTTRRAWR
jgi:hypothetical protein